jgi:hypothetical protein
METAIQQIQVPDLQLPAFQIAAKQNWICFICISYGKINFSLNSTIIYRLFLSNWSNIRKSISYCLLIGIFFIISFLPPDKCGEEVASSIYSSKKRRRIEYCGQLRIRVFLFFIKTIGTEKHWVIINEAFM